MDIEIFEKDALPSKILINEDHQVPEEDEDGFIEDTGELAYRLQNLGVIFYAVFKGQVVGHLGIDEDESVPTVKAVFVNKDARNKGVAKKLYLHAMKHYGELQSDEPDAMEKEAKYIWQYFENLMPEEVSRDRQGRWTYTKED